MFEQKSSKHCEQNLTYCIICSQEVALKRVTSNHETNSPSNLHKTASARLQTFEAVYLHRKLNKQWRFKWNSLNIATPSNNWPNYGNAAPDTSIFLLQNNGLHAFMLVKEKAEFVSSMSIFLPLKELMR